MAIPKHKIVLLGGGGVGKSAIILRFTHDDFVEGLYDPTMFDVYQDNSYNVDGEGCKLDITDTAGQEEYTSLHEQWILEADGFLLVYSLTQKGSLGEVKNIYETIQRVKEGLDCPIVVAGNKSDLAGNIEITDDESREVGNLMNAPHFRTSAKTGDSVHGAFQQLVREIRTKGTGLSRASGGGNVEPEKAPSGCGCTIL